MTALEIKSHRSDRFKMGEFKIKTDKFCTESMGYATPTAINALCCCGAGAYLLGGKLYVNM